ncbi:thioesterase family protein [Lacibacterium aquatile]|uniref:Thioesterase family protein n=1 Tax=Lacibacterium aquatile TaxID=1168082 RepID=A0ABW5DU49_9PROT
MNLLFRAIWVLCTSWRRRHVGFLEPAELGLLTFPNDLDINLHVNNGRYLSLLDLGRVDLMQRSGLWRHFFRRRWLPVVAGVMVRFRRSLKVCQRFTLTTRILGWDERFFYMEQQIVTPKGVAMIAYVRGCFVAPGGPLPTAVVLAEIGVTELSPELPEAVRHWAAAEVAMARQDPATVISAIEN